MRSSSAHPAIGTHDRFSGGNPSTRGRAASVENAGLASNAVPEGSLERVCWRETKSYRATRSAVEAELTEVALGLRRAWLAGPALTWKNIQPIHERAGNDFEKRVALALREGFFQFSQLLAGLEVLLLQLRDLGVVREETLLDIEELFVHRADHAGLSQGAGSGSGIFPDSDSGLKSAQGACDQSKINFHRNLPVVDEGVVGTSDSTACGDTGDFHA